MHSTKGIKGKKEKKVVVEEEDEPADDLYDPDKIEEKTAPIGEVEDAASDNERQLNDDEEMKDASLSLVKLEDKSSDKGKKKQTTK